MIPTEQEVRRAGLDYPSNMVHDCAARAIIEHGIPAQDLLWILASYELRKPRVVERVVSEAVRPTEQHG